MVGINGNFSINGWPKSLLKKQEVVKGYVINVLSQYDSPDPKF